MSPRTCSTNLFAVMHVSNRGRSAPTAAACAVTCSSVCGFANRRARISQYLPCSPAQRDAAAARNARLWMDSSGMSKSAYFTLPVWM